MDHRIVFVGGLHRSGTSLVARCIGAHPSVSAFRGTGVEEDEGQHLQDVYPTARAHGGPGRFALAPAAHLTERSPLASPANARRLFDQWAAYWDLTRPVLLEKSPANLVQARFLQALFPDAAFVMVVRHPAIVTLSTKKWARWRSLGALLDHWFHAHRLFEEDAALLDRVHVVKYEQLMAEPRATLDDIRAFLGLDGAIPPGDVQPGRSAAYERRWRQLADDPRPRRRRAFRSLCDRYEPAANHYGYSLLDLRRADPFPQPSLPGPST